MRPEKASRIISKHIREYLKGNRKKIKLAKPAIIKLHSKCKTKELNHVREGLLSAVDSRSGEETYGYMSVQHNINTMMYISDRYWCTFRLRWLLDGIDNGKLLE